MARVCVVDTPFGETVVRAGEVVTLLLGAANRDPARFPDPDTLWLERHPNPHLGFGRGAHSCLGSTFAALQARVALTALAGSGMRLIEAPTYRRTLTLRSVDRLNVALG
jgi:cytochrome P450